MMKSLLLTYPVILASLIFSGCASTEFEKRIENNFIYQCSLKLISDAEKKVSGDDAGKICTAAYQIEPKSTASPVAEPTITPTVEASPSATAVPTATPVATPEPKKSLLETDEIKPEPAPKE